MSDMNLNFEGKPAEKIDKRFPVQSRPIVACKVLYEDGTELEIPADPQSAFHRVNVNAVSHGEHLYMHEIFIYYKEENGDR